LEDENDVQRDHDDSPRTRSASGNDHHATAANNGTAVANGSDDDHRATHDHATAADNDGTTDRDDDDHHGAHDHAAGGDAIDHPGTAAQVARQNSARRILPRPAACPDLRRL
jgi:hypothetical protein